mmetsp:Transcript_16255/g.23694  ORF Transcript_16255/g.23694 Transcript_16255/m.23694 type:complete len:626 (+) Transcript_16255:43-1920(+)
MNPSNLCASFFEDFTITERASDCPTCLYFGVHCLGNFHTRKPVHQDGKNMSVVGRKRKIQCLTPSKSRSDKLLNEELGKARNSEGKLSERLTELARKDEFTVSINRVDLVFPIEKHHRVNLAPLKNAAVLSYGQAKRGSLGIPSSFRDPTVKEVPTTNYHLLQTNSESAFQKSHAFQSTFIACPHTHCMELSSSGKKIFHMPSAVDKCGRSASNDNTAKPDVAGLIMPKMMELKTDGTAPKKPASKSKPKSCCYDVLLQAVDRLVVGSDIRGYYCRFTCDAISSCNAYITSLTVDADGKRHIDISRISHNDINKLWVVQTQYAIAHPEYYVSEDATAIIDALLAFNIQWNVCRVSRVASSSSRVYFVTLPDEDGQLPLHKKPAFAMKINPNMPRFDNEVRALRDIAAQYKRVGLEHYALAYYRRSAGETPSNGKLDSQSSDGDYFAELVRSQTPIPLPDRGGVDKLPSQSTPKATKTTWYLHCRGNRKRSVGVLFLHVGVHEPRKARHCSAKRIQRDLLDCFVQVTQAGWLQTDVRTDNILYFNRLQRWCIIDYDLAVCTRDGDTKVTLKPGSARANACGGRLEMLLCTSSGGEVTVDWTIVTEMVMLIKFCVQIGVNEAVGESE